MVVVAEENIDLMMDIIQCFQHKKVRVVKGGSTRHRSIYNGVLALGEAKQGEDRPQVVIIHDAVRPFVEEDFLYKITMAAMEQGVSVMKVKFVVYKNCSLSLGNGFPVYFNQVVYFHL